MIYIMIVDDEPISADGATIYLENNGDPEWEIRTCYSPREVLNSLHNRIDVLITDVSMPEMNGVELARQVVARWPLTKIIFLTAYSDIQRAQEAVRMPESVDYLLKDEDPDQLMASVQLAISRIEREKATLSDRRQLEQQMTEALPMLQTMWLTKVIRGKMEIHDDLRSHLKRLQLPLTDAPVLMLVGRYSLPPEASNDREIAFFTLDNLVKTYTGSTMERCAVSLDDQQMVWLFQPRRENADKDSHYLFSALDLVQESFARSGGTVSFVLDDACYPWQQLPQRYKLLNSRSVGNPPDALVRQNNETPLEETWSVLSGEELLSRLQSGEVEQAARLIRQAAEQPPHTVQGRMELYRFLMKVLSSYMVACPSVEKMLEELPLPRVYLSDAKWAASLGSFAELLLHLSRTMPESSVSRSEQFIQQVKRLVQENITGDLSLVTMADRMSMSPSYFSRQFKKGMGVGYAEYVMETRIGIGAQLLRETNLTLNHITAQVGYYSVSHFIASFQRFYHMTPNEYRKHINQK